jgi:transcriptional regulator GlxA family with amidase domain
MDSLIKGDRAWRLEAGPAATRLFDVSLVGLDDRPVSCRDGVYLQPRCTAAELATPDLVIVPAIDDEEPEASFARNRAWGAWIKSWYRDGARIASSCTGAFLVADTGILDGRRATTHWLFADLFRSWFPGVILTEDRLIVDNGDTISSGGATAFLTLVLYLIERYGGHERARLAAKVLLVDGNRTSQVPYMAFSANRNHRDDLIREIQDHIDAHLNEPLLASDLAGRFEVSTRTLTRRFVAATGVSPQEYLQRTRVQEAARLLETTTEPIDRVRARVGYRDPSAFRRAFQAVMGSSPRGYRDHYGAKNPTPSSR